MKRKIVSVALAAAVAGFAPTAASAQLLGVCPSIIMPPPCIVFDYKKLADIAQRNAQEIAKVKATVQSIEQAKAATQGIMSQAHQALSFNPLSFAHDTTVSPVLPSVTGIDSMRQSLSGKLFSTDTVDGATTAVQQRQVLTTDANVEAYAYGVEAPSEVAKAEARYADLAKQIQASPDLRTDWSVNSEIKAEIISARTRNSYLLSSYIRMAAANGIAMVPPRSAGIGGSPAPAAFVAPATVSTDQSDKVRQLAALLSQAQSQMTSLQVVQMSGSAKTSLQGVIDDYNNTVARKAAALSKFQSDALRWRTDSKKGSSATTISSVLASLGSIDNQMAALRSQPMSQLGGAFAQRNIDVNAMAQADVDPRQFIGTWGDPAKYQTIQNMETGLLNTTLKGTIRGNDDINQFRQDVADYNDVRLEEAWKRGYADDARTQIAQIDAQVAQESQNGPVTADATTASLKDIVSQANALGQQIGAGSDANSKAQASDLLNQLQTLVGQGTSLPVVDTGSVAGASATGTGTGTTVTTPATTTTDDVPVTTGPKLPAKLQGEIP